MKSKHTRGHSRGHTGDKVHIPGRKHRSAGQGKPVKVTEDRMNSLMRDLEGEHRSIYENPYKRTQARREKRLTNKPL